MQHVIGVPCSGHLIQIAAQQMMLPFQCLVMRAGQAQSQSQNMHLAASPHSIALRDGCVGSRQAHSQGKQAPSKPWPGNRDVF